jgi:hypothetical protein
MKTFGIRSKCLFTQVASMNKYPPLSVLVQWREMGMTPDQIQESRILMANIKWTACPKCGKEINNRWLNRHLTSNCEIGIRIEKVYNASIPERVINHWRNEWGWTEEQITEACQRYSKYWMSRGDKQ